MVRCRHVQHTAALRCCAYRHCQSWTYQCILTFAMGLIQSRLNRMNRARQPVKEEPSEGVFDPSATLHADVGPSTGQRTMPAHWDLYKMEWLPSNLIYLKPIVKFFGTGLCLASLGHADLQEVWDICADDKMWLESTARLMDRLNTIVVVVSVYSTSCVCRPKLTCCRRPVCSSARQQHS